ncbi:MAG: helix-turn-helix transcriptional regulator [Methanobacteriota archaeon]
MDPTNAQLGILRALRDGPRQAQDIAAELAVDTSSVYRHLEALRAEGLVAAEDVIEGPGRPKKRYRLTHEGQEAFPRDYSLLLSALLCEVETRGGRQALLSHLDAIARNLAASLANGADVDQRLAALVDLYNRLGFEASVERHGNDVLLVQRNCPFLKTARKDPEALCECLDEGIMKAAVPEALVDLRETLAKGGRRCMHIIRLGAERPRKPGVR